mmetsp:Transcript_83243/g.225581  ORF Transcript_83243/g.225581 Transcript_83243/m.225581 type:complete len:273 (-) Transcript_83243:180-998(-)
MKPAKTARATTLASTMLSPPSAPAPSCWSLAPSAGPRNFMLPMFWTARAGFAMALLTSSVLTASCRSCRVAPLTIAAPFLASSVSARPIMSCTEAVFAFSARLPTSALLLSKTCFAWLMAWPTAEPGAAGPLAAFTMSLTLASCTAPAISCPRLETWEAASSILPPFRLAIAPATPPGVALPTSPKMPLKASCTAWLPPVAGSSGSSAGSDVVDGACAAPAGLPPTATETAGRATEALCAAPLAVSTAREASAPASAWPASPTSLWGFSAAC